MARVGFYLDEHVAHAVAVQLRRREIEAMTVVDSGLRTGPDEEHLRYATAHGLAMFTFDDDYLRLHARDPTHAGIIYSPHQARIGPIVLGLAAIYESVTAEEMRGRLMFF